MLARLLPSKGFRPGVETWLPPENIAFASGSELLAWQRAGNPLKGLSVVWLCRLRSLPILNRCVSTASHLGLEVFEFTSKLFAELNRLEG